MATFDFLSGFFNRTPKPKPTDTVGVPGTVIIGGYIQEDEKNSKLVGQEKYRTYSNLLVNIAIVGTGVRYFLNLVSKANWQVEPADDSPQAVEFAEKVEAMMTDMITPWHRVVRRAAMYRFYGFSIQEWTAKKIEDGSITFFNISPRPQITIDRWDTEEDGTVMGVCQRSLTNAEEIYLPRSKLVYMVDDTLNDSPEGLGLFRHIVEPADRLIRYQQLEGFGFETDLRGIPVGRAPFAELDQQVRDGVIDSTKRTEILKPLTDFIKNHIKHPQLGLLLDSLPYQSEDESARPTTTQQWNIDLLKGGNSSQEPVAKTIERLIREIALVLGVEGLLLGVNNVGSQALGVDKSQNLALIVDNTLKELTETFNSDLINPIWGMNGWPDEMKPSFKTDATQFRDIQQITGALRDLALAGAVLDPDDPAIDEVRQLLGLSDSVSFEDQVDSSDESLIGDGTGGDELPEEDETGEVDEELEEQ